jgi:excisionase family DNA binding protein
MSSRSGPIGKKLTLTVGEADTLIGISRAQAYRCVRSGELKAVQLGRRIVVPIVAVEELLGMSVDRHDASGDGARH